MVATSKLKTIKVPPIHHLEFFLSKCSTCNQQIAATLAHARVESYTTTGYEYINHSYKDPSIHWNICQIGNQLNFPMLSIVSKLSTLKATLLNKMAAITSVANSKNINPQSIRRCVILHDITYHYCVHVVKYKSAVRLS